ncbi:hypothetical protein P280DRAFT_506691 [Massarina eburnea CBS 473.64]|uniref:Uncharacterized protein n=1 Tax=Massarina eburnea CBS 473.64 TaxID=1395130 RepID=A0A6A6S1T8_9PLEO|nr:hypothetical protein P280DRAFT_506691 [Massarina eburnea CBS 473.64]
MPDRIRIESLAETVNAPPIRIHGNSRAKPPRSLRIPVFTWAANKYAKAHFDLIHTFITKPPPPPPPPRPTFNMKRNVVIFLIIFILFILLAAIAYAIYYVQTRMAVGGSGSSVTETSEV